MKIRPVHQWQHLHSMAQKMERWGSVYHCYKGWSQVTMKHPTRTRLHRHQYKRKVDRAWGLLLGASLRTQMTGMALPSTRITTGCPGSLPIHGPPAQLSRPRLAHLI